MVLQKIGVEATIEGLSSFRRGINGMNSDVRGFGSNVSSVASGLTSFGLALSKTIVAGTVAAASAITAFGVSSVKTAISFESAFAGVIKTVDGLVDESGNLTQAGLEMREEFEELSKTIPVAFEELAGIGELGGQLGVARDDIIDFTETIAKIGVTTNLTADEAATGFAQIGNVLGSSQEDLDRFASAVVELGNNSATTERDILAFSQRIAGAGAIAGLTEADVAGIGAAFASIGVESAAGGTAIQKVLLEMNTAVVEGGDTLGLFAQTAGQSVEQFATLFEQDAASAFTAFVEGLGRQGDEAVLTLDELGLADQRLVRAFLSVSTAGDLLSDSIDLSNKAFTENIALNKEAEQRFGTTESKIKLFKNTITDLRSDIGDVLLPVFGDLLAKLSELAIDLAPLVIGFFENVADFVSAFADTLLETGDLLGSLTVGLQNVVGPTSEAGQKILEISNGVRDFTQRLIEVAEPILTAVTNFVSWKDVLIVAAGAITAVVLPALASLIASIAAVALPVTAAIAIVALLRTAWEENFLGIQEKTAVAIEFVRNLITTALTAIQEFWNLHGQQILAFATAAWEGIMFVVDTIMTNIRAIFAAFKSAFEGDWYSFGEQLRVIWDNNWNAIKTILDTIGRTILEIIGRFILDIIAKFRDTDWGSVGQGIIDGIAAGIRAAARALAEAAIAAARAALDAAKGFLGIGSPSKLTARLIGQPFAEGIAMGINQPSIVDSAIGNLFGQALPMATAMQPVTNTYGGSSTVNNRSANVSFGDMVANTNVDLLAFREFILTTVNQAVGTS